MTDDADGRPDAGSDGDEFVFVDEATAADDDPAPETEPEYVDATAETEPEHVDATADTEPEHVDATADTEPEHVDATAETEPERADPSDEAPLADLAAEIRGRGERSQSDDDLFETVEVGEIDAEAVWADLEDDAQSDATPESPLSDAGAAAVDAAGEESVVPKRSYCERCRYFTDPPEVGCTHDGTEIVELVDADHFRVRDCPMVGDDDRDVAEFE